MTKYTENGFECGRGAFSLVAMLFIGTACGDVGVAPRTLQEKQQTPNLELASSLPVALFLPRVEVCQITAGVCGAVVASLTATFDPFTRRFKVAWSVSSSIDRSLT